MTVTNMCSNLESTKSFAQYGVNRSITHFLILTSRCGALYSELPRISLLSTYQFTAGTIMDAVHILEDFESIASYGRNQNSMHYQA